MNLGGFVEAEERLKNQLRRRLQLLWQQAG
jgi:hypothetical protein